MSEQARLDEAWQRYKSLRLRDVSHLPLLRPTSQLRPVEAGGVSFPPFHQSLTAVATSLRRDGYQLCANLLPEMEGLTKEVRLSVTDTNDLSKMIQHPMHETVAMDALQSVRFGAMGNTEPTLPGDDDAARELFNFWRHYCRLPLRPVTLEQLRSLLDSEAQRQSSGVQLQADARWAKALAKVSRHFRLQLQQQEGQLSDVFLDERVENMQASISNVCSWRDRAVNSGWTFLLKRIHDLLRPFAEVDWNILAPRGILFYGPPGKTLFHLAHESGAGSICCSEYDRSLTLPHFFCCL